EKRSEIAKIELKQRINVLLVPNKALETPNYKLERLKHDDPRLDNIEASYKMAEEIEDPTAVTRRSQEPTNKQTPIIKGVLPDAPAPVAPPKPEAPKPVVAPVQAAKAVTPAPVSPGFFSWLKALFGGTPVVPVSPVAAPAAAPVAPAGSRDPRSRDGGTARDGQRGGNRSAEGRGPRPEGRSEGARDVGKDGGRNGRGNRGGRGGRGEGPTPVPGQAGRDRFEAESKVASAEATLSTPVPQDGSRNEQRQERAPRGERGERGERNNRPPRNGGERIDNSERNPEARGDTAPADSAVNPNDGLADTREPREGGGRDGNNRGGRGRGRRSERGPRMDDNGQSAESPQAALGFAEPAAVVQTDQAEAGAEPTRTDSAPQGEGRDKRSRDRYGRERGPRQDRGERQDRNTEATARGEALPSGTEVAVASVAPVSAEVATTTAVPVSAIVPSANHESATTVGKKAGMPTVTGYALPTDALIKVAQDSGLQWVNSDPVRIAAVQAAIAAEPAPVHVPRERPAPVKLDQGPLVLVETKRNLGNMTLPFEETSQV
ncbi:MAG: ribonuclease E/G, partial [Burkholderiales bacterium PBB4]